MVEKIKKIDNPLTIIGIFAMIVEISFSIAFFSMSEEMQQTFAWFMFLFPFTLLVLFFITWNFNTKVLYAPSDFKNENNFLHTLRGVVKKKVGINNVEEAISNTEVKNDFFLETANNFFKELLQELKPEIKNENIETVYFSAQSVDYFLIQVQLSDKLIEIENQKEHNFILHIKPSHVNGPYLEIIGKNIISNDTQKLASLLVIMINEIITDIEFHKTN